MENQWNNPNLAEDLKLLDDVIKVITVKLKQKEYDHQCYIKHKSKRQAQHLLYYHNHKKHLLEKAAKHYQKNKVKLNKRSQRYYLNHKKETRQTRRVYYLKNKDKIIIEHRHYCRRKRVNDPIFRIQCNLRRRLLHAIKGNLKSDNTFQLVGCDASTMKSHLESKFQPGMTWENYGYRGWHIDHVKPCAAFDLSKPEEQKKCFHFSNLQPLWATDNLKKSDKMPDEVYNMV